MKHILFLLIIFIPILSFGQIQPQNRSATGERNLEQQPNVEEEKPPITDYKIISIANDTVVADTSLTIYKDYRFNYLRKDNFGLLAFSNVGQSYNRLTYDFKMDEAISPAFGARARHFSFLAVEDIMYFNVPTPYTEVYFRTVFEQGQNLQSLFTVNTSPNLNVSIGYKGLRSLGKYQHILTSTGNFQATINYQTPNDRYQAKAHFVSQDLMNQENGGLTPQALEQYLSGDEEYQDRSRLDVNFVDAESTLFGKRFYLNHSFDLVSVADSLSFNNLRLGHILNFSDKKFQFEQGAADPILGASYESVNIRDEVKLEHIYNEVNLNYGNSLLGNISVNAGLTSYNYGYNTALVLESGRVNNRLKGKIFSAGAGYAKSFGKFDFHADADIGLSGDFKGSNFMAGVDYGFGEDNEIQASLSASDRAPNFNFLLYQSDYVNYNWQNDFSNVLTQNLEVSISMPRIVNLGAELTSVSDYTYFGANEEGFVKPFQHDGTLNYFKVHAEKEFRLGKFALNNTVLYQHVQEGEEVFKVPDLVTRNTLYYQDHWFRRALFLQTGFTFNYFSNYEMNAYDPVLAEFYVQNEQEFDGFPTVDFFFNGKVRQARIFFKLEHLNSLLMGNDNFAAPLHPYRDFAVRFGLVWNFFM